MKELVLFAIGWIASVNSAPVLGQNLVNDPGFEDLSTCPTNVSCLDGYSAGWVSTGFTPDLYHACGFSGSATTNNNVLPHSGSGMVGMFQFGYWSGGGLYEREHVIGTLAAPLVGGELYTVRFFVRPVLVDVVNIGMGIGSMGAYLAGTPPGPPPPNNLYPVVPQVEHGGGAIVDLTGWTEIKGCFVAAGGEQYITIGNFRPDATSSSAPLAGATAPFLGYILVDDVSVEHVPVVLPLTDTIACDGAPVVLDASAVGAGWAWNDGTTSPTLMAVTSGVHWVDIDLGGCVVRDSCTVSIGTSPSVELGPDLVLCEGSEVVLAVDDPTVAVLWSDGSTGHQLVVDEAGVHWVSITNACGGAEDQVHVGLEKCICAWLAPNAFTPDGDGINDRFVVQNPCGGSVELMVFDRWGEVIHRATGASPWWSGDGAPIGVYAWQMRSITDDRTSTGCVTLLR